MSLPLTTDTLMKKWSVLERAGLPSFILRYGILRFAPLISGVALAIGMARRMPWVDMVVPALIIPAIVGSLWAVWTWSDCKKLAGKTPTN